jgi:hypothetical protein
MRLFHCVPPTNVHTQIWKEELEVIRKENIEVTLWKLSMSFQGYGHNSMMVFDSMRNGIRYLLLGSYAGNNGGRSRPKVNMCMRKLLNPL